MIGEVERFLKSNEHLRDLLIEARSVIRRFFPESDVRLELVQDYEGSEDKKLVAYIETTLEPEEAIECLRRFDDDWWLDQLAKSKGLLCIDVGYDVNAADTYEEGGNDGA